jgi:hypothetical protein
MLPSAMLEYKNDLIHAVYWACEVDGHAKQVHRHSYMHNVIVVSTSSMI